MANVDLFHLASLLTTVASATWFLAKKLGKIDKAISVHVAVDEEVHKDIEARVVKLERRWRR